MLFAGHSHSLQSSYRILNTGPMRLLRREGREPENDNGHNLWVRMTVTIMTNLRSGSWGLQGFQGTAFPRSLCSTILASSAHCLPWKEEILPSWMAKQWLTLSLARLKLSKNKINKKNKNKTTRWLVKWKRLITLTLREYYSWVTELGENWKQNTL